MESKCLAVCTLVSTFSLQINFWSHLPFRPFKAHKTKFQLNSWGSMQSARSIPFCLNYKIYKGQTKISCISFSNLLLICIIDPYLLSTLQFHPDSMVITHTHIHTKFRFPSFYLPNFTQSISNLRLYVNQNLPPDPLSST